MGVKVLNLQYKEFGDLKYEVINFPDGEIQLNILDSLCNFKDTINVVTRITNADDLFILMQAIDILNRHEIPYYVTIMYLMSQRSDRIFSYGRPMSLKVVLNALNNANLFYVFEPHNIMAINKYADFEEHTDSEWDKVYELLLGNGIPSFPDEGAVKRYVSEYYNQNYLYGVKVRDVNTGKIISYDIKLKDGISIKELKDNEVDMSSLIGIDRINIIDDLCDGGGTFLMAHEELSKYFKSVEINLCVAHMVQEAGIRKVCDKFDHVYTTNSYADWEKLGIKNLEVTNLWY